MKNQKNLNIRIRYDLKINYVSNKTVLVIIKYLKRINTLCKKKKLVFD